MPDVVERIAYLRVGKRAAGPIGTCLRLWQTNVQSLEKKLLKTYPGTEAGERGGELRIKDRERIRSRKPPEQREVLPGVASCTMPRFG